MRLAWTLLGLCLLAAGCTRSVAEQVLASCQELVIGDSRFIGGTSWSQGRVIYTELIVGLANQPAGRGVPTYFQLGGQRVAFADATVEHLRANGFPIARSSSSERPAFGVWLGGIRSDASIELQFDGDQAQFFRAQCYPGETCDFGFGWEGRPLISLPIDGRDLAQRLPEAGSLKRCEPAF